jgi:hypothetical protein
MIRGEKGGGTVSSNDTGGEYSVYSARKRGNASFRQSARTAALAMADFWSSIADSAVDVLSATADGVAAGCNAAANAVPLVGPTRDRAASYAAAARYYEELARIARETPDAPAASAPAGDGIDYERLAKAIIAEMKSNQA